MKGKYRIYLLALTLMFLIVIADNKRIIDVSAVDNYSNYLYNEPIILDKDKASILKDYSDGSNGYRNLFESGFVFPSKLQSEVFSTRLQGTNAKYSLSQIFLNNLDNDKSFKDFEIVESYQKTNQPTQSNIVMNKGIYNGITNITSVSGYPTSDYSVSWNLQPSTPSTHFDKVNDGLSSDYVYCDSDDENKIEEFGFDLDGYKMLNITSITIGSLIRYSGVVMNDFGLYLYWGSYSSLSNINLIGAESWIWRYNTFYSNFYNFTTLRVKYKASSSLGGGSDLLDLAGCIIYLTYQQSNQILSSTDNKYFEYKSQSESSGNHYQALYSFENDAVGSNPTGWTVDETGGTINVVSTLGLHNKIVELYDNSGSNSVYLYQSFSNNQYGIIEYWIRTTDATKSLMLKTYETSTIGLCFDIYNGYFAYWVSSYNNIVACSSNTWYHIRIEFECGSGAHYGLSADRWHVYINGIHYGDYSFLSGGSLNNFNKIQFYSETTHSSYWNYIDAIDYSWSSGYYVNRNRYPFSQVVNMTINHQIPLPNLSYHQLYALRIDYSLFTNITQAYSLLYLWNYYTHTYNLVRNHLIYNYLTENSYIISLNNTYYNSSYNIQAKLVVYYISNLLLKFDKFKITDGFQEIEINNEGYHELKLYIDRRTIANESKGQNIFTIQFYKNYLSYSYQEYTNGILYYWTNPFIVYYNLDSNLSQVEIQYHSRYGLNTLDLSICNYYFEIILNYNQTITIFEQQRYFYDDLGYTSIHFLKYYCMNRNRLNLTGIYGNYSFNTLAGIRNLRGLSSQNYDRYFVIPFFNDEISLLKYSVSSSSESNPDEPELPYLTYWTYQTFRVVNWKTEPINVGNWTFDYNYLKSEQYTAKYPYNVKSIDNSDLGNWQFKIKFSDAFSYTVNLNAIRNAVADIINLILLFIQVIMYGLTAGLSFIFMFLTSILITFIWNYPILYVFIALINILWYVFEGLIIVLDAIWTGLIWVYENLILPFMDWFFNVFFPLAIEVFIQVWAFLITCLIYCMTLGQIDFWETYDSVYTMLRETADFLMENTIIIMENLPALFIAISLYLVLIGMTYVKYVYCKIRGYKERAEALYDSLMTYLLPITLTYQIIKKIYNSIPTAGGG